MSQEKILSGYKILDYLMKDVDLLVDLTLKPVQATAKLTMIPNPAVCIHSIDLMLDGENMTLVSISLDGYVLKKDEYTLSSHSLIIKNVPQDRSFELQVKTELGENTDLFGLYETEGVVLVKAESEGLRRVFYCHDRPDNLATYTTTLIANKRDYPVLLSNGVIKETKSISNEIHSVTWQDDVPKPSYLFALVAGQLEKSVTSFKTMSERELLIEFYIPQTSAKQCDFAKEVLKKAMKWDEDALKLECELSHYMVAGVDKYATGASEPTGLNIFNTANLYATPETSTDQSMLRVLEVVAHEFFHYWSGDRVTIRDWFNLSLKEGLTTFRAAQFREDLFGTDLIRMLDGKNLTEKAPRPDKYSAVRSLYTVAAYDKSADIFRMIMLSVGKELFYQCLTQFFKTNDGKAVTLEELLYSISEQSHVDVSNFLPWFTETGIPRLVVTDAYDAETKSYSLSVNCTGTKQRPIPLVIGLIDSSGTEILSDHLLKVDHEQMVFHFNNIASRPTPSLLRSFSAPVTLHYNYTNEALIHLMLHDSNEYNRCEAMHALMENLVKASCEVSKTELSSEFIITYKLLFKDPTLTPWTLAEILSIPAEEDLFSNLSLPDYSQISKARKRIVRAVATALRGEIDECLKHLDQWIGSTSPQFSIFDIHEAGKRKLLKVLYSYLLAIEPNSINKVKQLFYDSLDNNMTNTINALSLLCDLDTKETEDALNAFYVHWQHDTNAINYWLTIQAGSHSSKVVNRVRYLMSHLAFDITNPNKVYALLGTFINNLYGFHNASGKGYEVITDAVLQLDIINPSLAARLTDGFAVWSKHKATQQKMMQKQLQIIYQSAVSFDVKNSAQQALDKT